MSSSQTQPATSSSVRNRRRQRHLDLGIADKDGGTTEYRATVEITVTYASLCTLTQSLVTGSGISSSLCKKLDAAAASAARGNANAHDGQLGAYRNELDAQAGKALTAGGAALLQSLSESL